VAEIENAFIASGESATIFDYERTFVLKKGPRQMFTVPPEETPSCELKQYKKLVSILQIHHELGHVLSEQLSTFHKGHLKEVHFFLVHVFFNKKPLLRT
jgi:hypothetical protein